MSLNHSYIGFGANLGEPQRTFADVLRLMEDASLIVRRISNLYRTTPWGGAPGPDYLNAVIELDTGLSALELFEVLQSIEKMCGRERPYPNAPRICDLDLLLHREEIISTEALTVPHPLLHMRRFVLTPLCDLVPEEKHPTLNVSFRGLLSTVQDGGDVRFICSAEEFYSGISL
ncbi:2-amino-4-hydroxy-6-hydroxymethyldihydropteridine diphosphokinase [bacterium]|nr:2-amino-4-hydroxy-6-hydroxymethyldihydropteridine diphosphokinase [bacterium]